MAVTVAVWLLVIVPAVAVNVALVAAELTVTDAGTPKELLLLASETAAPPLGAACDRVTVQVLVTPVPMVAGAHASELTAVGATKLIVVFWDALLYVPVIVAL